MLHIIESVFPVACAYFWVAFGDLYVVNLVLWNFVYWQWVNTEKSMCLYVYVTVYTHNAKHTYVMQNFCSETTKFSE